MLETVGIVHAAREAMSVRLAAEGVPIEAWADRLPTLPDARQIDAYARALKTTLEIAPGLASFDSATDANADAERGAFASREEFARAVAALPRDLLVDALTDDRKATG
jgi:hypothetical protein